MTSTEPLTRTVIQVCGTADPVRTTAGGRAEEPPDFPWSRRTFTYAFDQDTTDPIGATDARAAVRRAFRTWERAGADLRFTEVPLTSPHDIRVSWTPTMIGPTDTDPQGHDMAKKTAPDGTVSDVAAHAGFPPLLTEPDKVVPLHFDQGESTWHTDSDTTAGPDPLADVEQFAVHEIGHILGLHHSDTTTAVMYRKAQPAVLRDLTQEDTDRIVALYPAQGRARLNGIWVADWDGEAAWDVAEEDVDDLLLERAQRGYWPHALSGYATDVGHRYQIAWWHPQQPRVSVFGRSRSDFNQQVQLHKDAGFDLVRVNAFVGTDGRTRWNAVWYHPEDGPAGKHVHDWNRDDFDKRAAGLAGDGWRLIDVNGYARPDGTVGWNGCWDRGGNQDGFTRSTWDLTREEFDAEVAVQEADHFRLIDIATYLLPAGGGERWSGIWMPFTPSLVDRRDVWAWHGVDFERLTTRWQQQAQDVRPWLVSGYYLPPAHTTTTTADVDELPAGELTAGVLGVAVDDVNVYATHHAYRPGEPLTTPKHGSLAVIDRATGAKALIEVGYLPRSVAVDPALDQAYVVNAHPETFTVSIVDIGARAVVGTVPVGQGPVDVAVHAGSHRVYVANPFGRCVHVLDGVSRELVDRIEIGPGPTGLAVAPQSGTLYVALSNRSFEPHVTALGVVTAAGDITYVPLGDELNQPIDVAVDEANDRIYVANLGGGGLAPSVTVLDLPTLELVGSVPVPGPARAIAVNGDAHQVYVAVDSAVLVIDDRTLRIEKTLHAGPAPRSVAAAGGTARQLWVGDGLDGSLTMFS